MQAGFHEFISRCEGSDTTGEKFLSKLTLKDIQKYKVTPFLPKSDCRAWIQHTLQLLIAVAHGMDMLSRSCHPC